MNGHLVQDLRTSAPRAVARRNPSRWIIRNTREHLDLRALSAQPIHDPPRLRNRLRTEPLADESDAQGRHRAGIPFTTTPAGTSLTTHALPPTVEPS